MGRWPHSTHPISIHAPRVGSDFAAAGILLGWRNFNPRSPCGERRPEDKMEHLIRAFQSTLPVWGATPAEFYVAKHNYISIHAPRVGSDVFTPCTVASSTDFNPRSPCGERRWPGLWGPIRRYFNPRSPCGERLCRIPNGMTLRHFNPRSPCGERLDPSSSPR